MKKKIIPIVVALVLILIVALVGFGGKILDKYTYSKELADLDEYYGVIEGELAIILQDDWVEEKAALREGRVYFDLDTVFAYLNEGFYVDMAEGKLLYTTANDTAEALFDGREYSDRNGSHPTEYMICYAEGEAVYVAADYIKLFSNYSWSLFDRHVQVYTQWGQRQTMEVARDTQIRVLGGIKSPILREMEKGETVEVLEEMESWSKVKTSDSIVGYIENKRLANPGTETELAVTDYVAEEYTSVRMPGKVSLAWHAIGGEGGNDTLADMLAEGKGLNVIAPTWFSLNDNDGNFRSFASTKYIQQAHDAGLQVWGVWDNFNYKNETGADISSYEVLSSTTKRRTLVQSIVDTASGLGLEGVNIDFEGLDQKCGVHYVQFLKELSVLCRSSGLILSIDNYVPFNFNNYYRLDVQGQIADYVIIMGYDEHWHGSGDPGSVASIEYVSNGLARTLEEEQVPAEKVVNALPFYTILWKTEGAEVTDQYITLNNVEDYLQRMNIQPEWDEAVCQNYAEWQSGSATYQIWVEDEESIAVKLNVMNAKNIGGVAVWRLGYGTSEAWDLIAAFANS
ncbi:glycosyl hydrolase family 18 protein [Acetatifactor muris]|uniref:Sporulation-specific glycosylase YdhD n=1 Tax=Acetatifactor muris TaxID=879566 RepID=A0A2K4ZLH0_9FIRM|nr:glycosyl hydrolase family 18 protein [Acetatifactor muris]MCR2049914.1 glycosyl hydrolase family 18 protein [Acetatifactor muris]SOY31328.1 Putative sporulation-specific glycosylase YdhD [Acetatifactor muris]